MQYGADTIRFDGRATKFLSVLLVQLGRRRSRRRVPLFTLTLRPSANELVGGERRDTLWHRSCM
jgi:hypothetical protein